jgi:hypothetical protein
MGNRLSTADANRQNRTPCFSPISGSSARPPAPANAQPSTTPSRVSFASNTAARSTCYACSQVGHRQNDPACPKFGALAPKPVGRVNAGRATLD